MILSGESLAEELPDYEAESLNNLSHDKQISFHAHLGSGYRFIGPYNSEYCGELGKKVCLNRSPLFLDLGVSYGLSSSVELFLELRFGMENDFGPSPSSEGPAIFSIQPGVRYYIEEYGRSKVFSTLQMVVDTSEYIEGSDIDLAVKNVNGLLFDLHQFGGMYIFVAEMIGWKRWLRFEIEAGMGVQLRFG